MKIIRKKLDGGTTFPKNIRYNELTDAVEVTYDNGETWVENELLNPRTSPALIQATPPMDTQCDTANNVRAFLQSNLAQVLAVLTQFDTASGVVGALVTILITAFLKLGPFGIIVALFFALATYLVGLGRTAIEYAFIADEWDIVLCNIYTNTPNDGVYTQANLDGIIADNASTLNTTAAGIIDGMLLLMGFVGMTNAGKIGTGGDGCDGCGFDWCYTFDFSGGQLGWTMKWCNGTQQYGTFDGDSFNSAVYGAQKILWLYRTWTPQVDTIIEEVEIHGVNVLATLNLYQNGCAGSTAVGQLIETDTYLYDISWSAALGHIYLNQITTNSAPTIAIDRVTFRGNGTNPFGTDNC